MRNYVTSSLEVHLFFGRIMKEHSLFLMDGFPSSEKELISRADCYAGKQPESQNPQSAERSDSF